VSRTVRRKGQKVRGAHMGILQKALLSEIIYEISDSRIRIKMIGLMHLRIFHCMLGHDICDRLGLDLFW
jgi:hypothetical protein